MEVVDSLLKSNVDCFNITFHSAFINIAQIEQKRMSSPGYLSASSAALQTFFIFIKNCFSKFSSVIFPRFLVKTGTQKTSPMCMLERRAVL